MKRILKFFRSLGDALGLVILLGGLMIATNNAGGARRASENVRAGRKRNATRALNARRARAAV